MLINAIQIFTSIIFTAAVFKNGTIHSLQIHNKLNRWFEYPTKSIWHTRINHNNWGITVFGFPHDIEKLGTKSCAFSFIEGKDFFQNSFKKTYETSDLIFSFPFGTCFLGRNGLCLLHALKKRRFCWQRMIKLQYSQMSTTCLDWNTTLGPFTYYFVAFFSCFCYAIHVIKCYGLAGVANPLPPSDGIT